MHKNILLSWDILVSILKTLVIYKDKPREHIKKQRHHFADKGWNSQSYGFCNSHVWDVRVDQKECWALNNWCFQTMVLEKTLESPLDSKEIKPVNPVGNKSWILIGRADAKASILWSPDLKSWLTGKGLDAEKVWGKEEEGAAEDDMVEWHHWLNGYELEQILGYIKGQGSLVYCSPWSHKESDMT